MNIQVAKKNTTLAIENYKTMQSNVSIYNGTKTKNAKLISLYSSLIGPKVINCVSDNSQEIVRDKINKFDWHVGFCHHPEDNFRWLESLREEYSIVIQLVISTPLNVEFIEIYADMMGLQPLNQSLDPKPDFLNVVTETAITISPNKNISTLLEKLNNVRNTYKKNRLENKRANIYRINRFITKQGIRGIEWILSKELIKNWGSLLKGSVYLIFFKDDNDTSKIDEDLNSINISLYPRLGFCKKNRFRYVPCGTETKNIKIINNLIPSISIKMK